MVLRAPIVPALVPVRTETGRGRAGRSFVEDETGFELRLLSQNTEGSQVSSLRVPLTEKS